MEAHMPPPSSRTAASLTSRVEDGLPHRPRMSEAVTCGRVPWHECMSEKENTVPSTVWAAVAAKGQGPCGRVPALRVIYAMESAR